MDNPLNINTWRTSSFSGQAGTCVEVGAFDGVIKVRHSQRPDAEVIEYTPQEWLAFIAGAKAGQFDSPAEWKSFAPQPAPAAVPV